jgi:hypothetical protein
MRYRNTLWIAAVLVAAACDNSTGPTRYSAVGTWAGQETDGPTHVTLKLTQTSDSIHGSGTLNGGDATAGPQIAVTVSGAVMTTSFDLVLTADRYQPLHISGAFTGRNEMEAYMMGSGFYGEQILLHRK